MTLSPSPSNPNAIHALHSVSTLRHKDGGPAQSIPALCKAISEIPDQCNVSLATNHKDPTISLGDSINLLTLSRTQKYSQLRNYLCTVKNSKSNLIIHDHGQWLQMNRIAASLSRNLNIPRIVSPRGMLTTWSLNHHWLRKKMAYMLFAKHDLQTATGFHATSEAEAIDLRKLGVRQPIAVIPNAVYHRNFQNKSLDNQKPYALFLSRLHPKKGLYELLRAWSQVKPLGWDLVIAGPDEMNMLRGYELPPNIRYVGKQDGESKWQLLQNAHLFILPTYSENFGIVVAEAMMAGTAVITTQNAPWQCLAEENCGWWIPMTDKDLQQAIRHATQTELSTLESMGKLGHSYATRNFSWQSVGYKMLGLYEYLLNHRARPSFVVFP
jgi:glycosyltransferase involved in cell wall biosynthesis